MCTCPNLNHAYGCPSYKGTPSNLEVFCTDTPWELQDTEEAPVEQPPEPGESFTPLGIAVGLTLAFVCAYLWIFPAW